MKFLRSIFLALALVGFLPLNANAQPIPVDLQLVLAVDVSGSVVNSEFVLQRDGYVQAFQSAAIQNAITSGPLGQIAVTYVYWSGNGEQEQTVDWTLIDGAASAEAFATAISTAPRPFTGLTGIGQAINFSAGLFAPPPDSEPLYQSTRQIIDISGDGTENVGGGPTSTNDAERLAFLNQARDNFTDGAPLGVSRAINAVAIGSSSLVTYFENNVIGGTDSFALFASTFAGFATAIDDKLLREIQPNPIPEPATLALLGLGLAGLGVATRRRRTS